MNVDKLRKSVIYLLIWAVISVVVKVAFNIFNIHSEGVNVIALILAFLAIPYITVSPIKGRENNLLSASITIGEDKPKKTTKTKAKSKD